MSWSSRRAAPWWVKMVASAAVLGAASGGGPTGLARVGSVEISKAQVEERSAERLDHLRFRLVQAQARYYRAVEETKAEALRELIEDELLRMEAEKLRVPVEELRRTLSEEGRLETLAARQRVEVLWEPARYEVASPAAPVLGPATAAVTIVEFGDFRCPLCAAIAPTLRQALGKYEGRVRLLYRHFPLASFGELTFDASLATTCAQEQGKFWEMHDALLGGGAILASEGPEALAREVELDLMLLRSCMSSPGARTRVRDDQEAGARAGVLGTPTLFVNGVYLAGNVSLERLSEVIEAELARSSPSPAL